MKLEFLQQILEKNREISYFMKIRPVEAELLPAVLLTHLKSQTKYSNVLLQCGGILLLLVKTQLS
jgi:hypothetical protein